MTLTQIAAQLSEWMEEHDYEEEFEDFDELCVKIMSDKQTYFQWEVDGDCFEIDTAFDTVIECLKEQQDSGKLIADYHVEYLEDGHLFVFVEYK